MGFTALYIIADFQLAEQNVNMKQRLAGTAQHTPLYVNGGMSYESTASQIHNIQVLQIMINLLNLYETYKPEKKTPLNSLGQVVSCVNGYAVILSS